MGVSKVIYDAKVLIDLTADSVTPENMLEGVTAHNAAGEQVTGNVQRAEEASF